MRKIFFYLSLFLEVGYATPISCVNFATMDVVSVQKYIKRFNNVEVIKDESNEGRKRYLSKNREIIFHSLKCKMLRSANVHSVNTLVRIQALQDLEQMRLYSNEKKLFKRLLKENKTLFQKIGLVSLVSKEASGFPLLYLSGQKTKNGVLIYEKRLKQGHIRTFYKYLDLNAELVFFGSTKIDDKNRYLEFLNSYVFLGLKEIEEPKTTQKPIVIFEVKKQFKAVNFFTNKHKTFYDFNRLKKVKETSTEVFFVDLEDNKKYRMNKQIFKQKTLQGENNE